MKNCLLLIAAVAVSVSFHQTGVAGQTSSRLCGIAQQEEFQSWLKLNIAEMELEDKEPEKDDSKIDFIQQWLHQLVERLISTSYPTAGASNISRQCQNDSIEYVHNLYQRTWAMQSKLL